MATHDLRAELERHHPAAFGWAMHCCGRDRAEAEDVLQMTYLKVLEGRAVFGGRSSFKTWLLGVIRHTASERWRLRLLPARWLDHVETPAPGDDPQAEFARSETAIRLARELRQLPQRQRDVLHLVFYQDLTIEQAAGVIGVGLGTARTHYERGKARLRERLGIEG